MTLARSAFKRKPVKAKAIKPKKCRACKELFRPVRALQNTCHYKCAAAYVRDREEKRIKRENAKAKREYREKSHPIQTKLAQTNFNKFIRLRDAADPCISCQRPAYGIMHAGHYRSVGAHPELRFNEFNVHKQCAHCNKYQSGAIGEYRVNLIKKIGLEKVVWLEGPHPSADLTVAETIEIKKLYAAICRELEGKVK